MMLKFDDGRAARHEIRKQVDFLYAVSKEYGLDSDSALYNEPWEPTRFMQSNVLWAFIRIAEALHHRVAELEAEAVKRKNLDEVADLTVDPVRIPRHTVIDATVDPAMISYADLLQDNSDHQLLRLLDHRTGEIADELERVANRVDAIHVEVFGAMSRAYRRLLERTPPVEKPDGSLRTVFGTIKPLSQLIDKPSGDAFAKTVAEERRQRFIAQNRELIAELDALTTTDGTGRHVAPGRLHRIRELLKLDELTDETKPTPPQDTAA